MTQNEGVGMKKTAVKANEFGAFRVAGPVDDGAVPPQSRRRAKKVSPVELRLEEAGRVLRMLPFPKELVGLSQMRSALPTGAMDRVDLIEAQRDADKQAKRAVTKPAGVSGVEMDRFDEVMGWLLKLDADDRRLAFMRLLGFGYRKIAARYPAYGSKDGVARAWERVKARLADISAG